MELDNLSPEIQEKVKTCKTPEEVIELAKEEGYELSNEELEGISGGWGDPNCPDKVQCREYCYRLNTI